MCIEVSVTETNSITFANGLSSFLVLYKIDLIEIALLKTTLKVHFQFHARSLPIGNATAKKQIRKYISYEHYTRFPLLFYLLQLHLIFKFN